MSTKYHLLIVKRLMRGLIWSEMQHADGRKAWSQANDRNEFKMAGKRERKQDIEVSVLGAA
jgi:hypothetical protein